ncbi:hypothetical protein, partial [Streptomyces sp. NPDC093808]|uniref:hypothetical protein n=1 Tax=Streptomyces sp. NPDC093808 TaxID=3154985 RepID=UPI00344BFD16
MPHPGAVHGIEHSEGRRESATAAEQLPEGPAAGLAAGSRPADGAGHAALAPADGSRRRELRAPNGAR